MASGYGDYGFNVAAVRFVAGVVSSPRLLDDEFYVVAALLKLKI